MLFAVRCAAASTTTTTPTATGSTATVPCSCATKRETWQRRLAVSAWRFSAIATATTAAPEARGRRREPKRFQELIVVQVTAEGTAAARLQTSGAGTRRRRRHESKWQLVVIIIVTIAAYFGVVVARGKSGRAAPIGIVIPVVNCKAAHVQLPCMPSSIACATATHGVSSRTPPRCSAVATTATRTSVAKSLAASAL